MLFPTLSFAVFFALVLPASWLLMHRRIRWRLFMVAASWFFYGAADWRFVPLLAGSTLVNHVFARLIHRSIGKNRSRWTAAAVATNLAVLGWFKYIGFFALSAQSILHFVGLSWRLPLPDVVLPIGISFFTFQALSYVIDTARRKVEPVSLLEFAVYLSFFPHLIAGPIVRASEFLPQIRRSLDPRRVDIGRAFWLIALGLFKKVVIASYLGTYAADPLFGFPHQHAGVEALFGVYAYAIQIYADFSGYTDIAIGLALLIGIRFPQNFNAPYAATSLQDFWRRWHMTLSRWLRDYLYIPLGGNRRSKWRTYVNLMLTMVLGGLWHGAAWTFVAWGGLHGGGLSLERLWMGRKSGRPVDGGPPADGPPAPPEPDPPASAADHDADAVGDGEDDDFSLDSVFGPVADAVAQPAVSSMSGPAAGVAIAPAVRTAVESERPLTPARAWLGRIITFHVVCLAWVFFRATSFHDAIEVLARICDVAGHHLKFNWKVAGVIIGALACQLGPRGIGARLQARYSRAALWAQVAWFAVVLSVIDLLGPVGVAPFIYFRF